MTVLIITGMHRSGTSLIASLMQKLGVNVGEKLFPADRFNPRGYFEDVDFLEFQRQVLQKCCDPDDPGWHDWGWTVQETLKPELFFNYKEQAIQLLATREHWTGIWGWKDPRTSLMLDFWHSLIPAAKYLFVFRYPWDVADSIRRLHAPIFTEHPEYVLPIWCYYNRHLLSFYRRYPQQCVLFCVNHLDRLPQLINLCQTKLNLPLRSDNLEQVQQEIFDRSLFHQLPPQQQSLDTNTMAILQELTASADL
ncbi:MAG: hypothetical protein RMK91_09645 [Pseudanabaenaceae cyanobacterium SKYGB_i_bin29]|nr:hypothetical protein [Pseudanabaenaceae cyanobacterium SKYG29]MDW8422115.1 hypothetical protein [Pseudanabaenaceae cyanobacterium SKYGB_i_bin29]